MGKDGGTDDSHSAGIFPAIRLKEDGFPAGGAAFPPSFFNVAFIKGWDTNTDD
jgi:hypothetical protein